MTGRPPRAFYRGYSERSGRRAGQVRRLHIVRERGPKDVPAGSHGWCGIHATGVTDSPPIILDPMPDRPPEGLTWCPACIGHLAEILGQLGEVAASLAAYGSLFDDEIESAHDAEREKRRVWLLRMEPIR